jgi:hypothetical protein
MSYAGIEHPIFKPARVKWIFLAGDILSFFIQAGGGGLTASHDIQTAKVGTLQFEILLEIVRYKVHEIVLEILSQHCSPRS